MGNVCGAPRNKDDADSNRSMKDERYNKKEDLKTPVAKMNLDKKKDSERNTLSELNEV